MRSWVSRLRGLRLQFRLSKSRKATFLWLPGGSEPSLWRSRAVCTQQLERGLESRNSPLSLSLLTEVQTHTWALALSFLSSINPKWSTRGNQKRGVLIPGTKTHVARSGWLRNPCGWNGGMAGVWGRDVWFDGLTMISRKRNSTVTALIKAELKWWKKQWSESNSITLDRLEQSLCIKSFPPRSCPMTLSCLQNPFENEETLLFKIPCEGNWTEKQEGLFFSLATLKFCRAKMTMTSWPF